MASLLRCSESPYRWSFTDNWISFAGECFVAYDCKVRNSWGISNESDGTVRQIRCLPLSFTLQSSCEYAAVFSNCLERNNQLWIDNRCLIFWQPIQSPANVPIHHTLCGHGIELSRHCLNTDKELLSLLYRYHWSWYVIPVYACNHLWFFIIFAHTAQKFVYDVLLPWKYIFGSASYSCGITNLCGLPYIHCILPRKA